MKEYELKSSDLADKYGQKYEDLYSRCRKEFEAYCILNRKVFDFLIFRSKRKMTKSKISQHSSTQRITKRHSSQPGSHTLPNKSISAPCKTNAKNTVNPVP